MLPSLQVPTRFGVPALDAHSRASTLTTPSPAVRGEHPDTAFYSAEREDYFSSDPSPQTYRLPLPSRWTGQEIFLPLPRRASW